MNARDKARAAKLRRLPDDMFFSEALRRGFERYKGRTWIPTRDAEDLAHKLELIVELMLDGRNEIGQLRTVRVVARELRGFIDLTKQLDPTQAAESEAAK